MCAASTASGRLSAMRRNSFAVMSLPSEREMRWYGQASIVASECHGRHDVAISDRSVHRDPILVAGECAVRHVDPAGGVERHALGLIQRRVCTGDCVDGRGVSRRPGFVDGDAGGARAGARVRDIETTHGVERDPPGRIQPGARAHDGIRGPDVAACAGVKDRDAVAERVGDIYAPMQIERSEEHTSELQSPCNLVCRLLLEKKKNKRVTNYVY